MIKKNRGPFVYNQLYIDSPKIHAIVNVDSSNASAAGRESMRKVCCPLARTMGKKDLFSTSFFSIVKIGRLY